VSKYADPDLGRAGAGDDVLFIVFSLIGIA